MSRSLLLAATLVGLVLGAPAGLAETAKPAPAQKPAAAPKPAAKPAAPTPAAVAPEITPNHLALAKEVMLGSGLARSFDSILPTFGQQIRQQALTRPEMTKDLDDVLVKLEPEMELQKQRMIDIAARIYANQLSEAELQDIATFFRSPSGKRYVATQPQILDQIVQSMQGWTQDVSEYTMVRVRAEMAKRGHDMQ